MTRLYAQGTSVPVERSRLEIERLVKRRGAKAFGSYSTADGTSVIFEVSDRRIRFVLPIPKIDDPGKREAEERRRWRCLVLNVKAKFEAVENGIVTFDEEFLAHIVVPGSEGETIGERAAPMIKDAYLTGRAMPPLLPQAVR